MNKIWKWLNKQRHFNWPYLGFYLRIPLIDIGTHIMTQRFEMDTFDYVALRIRVWRWEWMFRLYQPNKERFASSRRKKGIY